MVGEERVYTHGDPFPWNIFVDPLTGDVQAWIDAEESGFDFRTKEIANAILGFIDARKNNPLLIEHAEELAGALISQYERVCAEYRSSRLPSVMEDPLMRRRLHFYLVTQLLHGAQICHDKWHVHGWVQFRLSLAYRLIQLEEFTLPQLFAILNEGIGSSRIEWAGNFDVATEGMHGPASGRHVHMGGKEGITVYAEVLVPDRVGDAVFAHSLSVALLWHDARTGDEWFSCPVEFIGMKGRNFYVKGWVETPAPGEYEVRPVVSTDNGKTWVQAVYKGKGLTIEVFEAAHGEVVNQGTLRAAVLGDPHGELDGIRIALEKLNIIQRGESFTDDEWVMRGVTVVIIGDIVDRGPQQSELYHWYRSLRNAARKRNSQFVLIIGNHELKHLQGAPEDTTLESAMPDFREQLLEDIRNGEVLAAMYLEGRIIVHGGNLPHIEASVVRDIRPSLIGIIAESLGKEIEAVSDEDIARYLHEHPYVLRLDGISRRLNRRFLLAAEAECFDEGFDIIFAQGNAHFGPYQRGEEGYQPGGIFWADFDDELSLVPEDLLLPQIVGHKEGPAIRWTPSGTVVNVNLLPQGELGRNAGALIHDGRGWKAVYFDGRDDEDVPHAQRSYFSLSPQERGDGDVVDVVDDEKTSGIKLL